MYLLEEYFQFSLLCFNINVEHNLQNMSFAVLHLSEL